MEAKFELTPAAEKAKKEPEPGDQLALIRKLERENRELRAELKHAFVKPDIIEECVKDVCEELNAKTYQLLLGLKNEVERGDSCCISEAGLKLLELWGIE